MAGCTMASDHKPLDICQSTTDPEIIEFVKKSLSPKVEFTRSDGYEHTWEKELQGRALEVQDCSSFARASLTPIQNESVVYIGTAFTYRVNYGSGEVFLERME
tara:strand:- start:120 stop:428 length:309 start_codon:yes stop_codon:yes gene_type:complete